MTRVALKLLNGIYGWLIGTVILTASVYSVYSIWDNYQVYQAAEVVQNLIREFKPVVEEAEEGPSFDDLRAINDDVIAWITVDGTNVDYPVVQGDTNLTYMDKDIYGEFSLAGSIFLDIRNHPDFSDNYSLIYGHNMDKHLMFGDLALFKDKDFFTENTTASLMIPGEERDFNVAAVLQIPAGTEEIFNPDKWQNNLDGFGTFLEKNSIWYHKTMTQLMTDKPQGVEIITLVTCSDGSTNDRTVLVLVREKPQSDEPAEPDPDKPKPGKPDDDDIGTGESSSTGDRANPKFWLYMTIGSFIFIVLFEIYDRKRKAL